jgi:hypothetical protein
LSFLMDLAADVWRLLLRVPDRKIATNAQCARFLDDYNPYFDDYNPYFPNRDVKVAIAAIEKAADVQGPRIYRNPNQLEYRIERPMLFAPASQCSPSPCCREC